MADMFTEIFIAAYVIAIWSSLYKENPIYSYVIHGSIGAVFGYQLFMGAKTLWEKTLSPLMSAPTIDGVLVTILGVLILTRLVPGYEWISKFPIAFSIGITMAVTIRGAIYAQFLKQIQIQSFLLPGVAGVNNFVIALFAVSTVIYFIFSREHKGIQYVFSRIGRTALMIAFGAMMATFFMGNVSFSIVQVSALVTPYGKYATIVAALLIALDLIRSQMRTKEIEQTI